MKGTALISFVKQYIEDDYALEVFYYSVKKAFVDRKYSLHGISDFIIDGRFLGDRIRITTTGNYRTPVHSLALILSLRMIMLDHDYLKSCDDDSLIFMSKPRESFRWIGYMSLIMDNWDDDEVKMLFRMMENYYYDDEFSDEDITAFEQSIILPEYRNEKAYYSKLAQENDGVSNYVIGNNAFVEAKIKNYIIPKDIAYVGNTAFAYCDELETLEFEGKTMFGVFPIVECFNLKKIIVPDGLLTYYSECLPYYEALIKEKSSSEDKSDKEVVQKRIVKIEKEFDESEIEHVYIDIPSADPYIEIDIPVEAAPVLEEDKQPIDTKILRTVFEKKATSYKYFWLMAIISLAKEKEILSISYKDITIRMASMAWPIVFENDIDLGKVDQMKKYLEEIVKKTKLIQSASSTVVQNYIGQHYSSQGIDKILAPLMKNVPYRFLSPWIKYTNDEEVREKSKASNFNGLYSLHQDFILLDEDWWDYINEHYLETCNFIMNSFMEYAKQYNSPMKLVKFMTTGWSLIRNKDKE